MPAEVTVNTESTIPAIVHPVGVCLVHQVVSPDSSGARIAQFRKDKGMTQKELAERLGVSQPVVSDYETGVIRLPADVVVEIAKILGVTTDEILGLKPEARSAAGLKNRRLSRRLRAIDALPKRDQEALLRTIDAFIAKTA
jgi:transcriptional regulator with XRE-family HTH domain